MKDFYDIADELDVFREQKEIDPDSLNELLEIIYDQKFAAYFFHELGNDTWIDPLHDSGYFYKIPEPIEASDNPGFYSLPTWYSGEYLRQHAVLHPFVVKEVALGAETENARAIGTILKAIIQIPDELAAETVKAFHSWTANQFARSTAIVVEMGQILEKLSKGDQIDAALELLKVITTPIPDKDFLEKENTKAGSAHDDYWLRTILSEKLHILIAKASLGVIKALEKQLKIAIDLEYDKNVQKSEMRKNSYWRLNIRPDLDTNYRRDFKNHLVNSILQAFRYACENKITGTNEILSDYLSEEYFIFRRICLYVLRFWGEDFPDLLEEAYGKRWDSFTSEYDRFLDAQFSNFSKARQKEILEKIYDLPDDDFIKFVDSRIVEFPNEFAGESIEEKRESYMQEWRFRELHRFADHLFGKYKTDYSKLSKKYEEPPEPTEQGVVVTSWEGEDDEKLFDDLSEKSINGVIQYLVDYVPSVVRFRTNRESLGRIFQQDVKARIQSYVEHVQLLRREDLRFVYINHYFAGINDSLDSGMRFTFEGIVDFSEYVSQIEKEPFELERYEPGLLDTKLQIARFCEKLFITDQFDLSDKLVSQIGKILIHLLDHPDEHQKETISTRTDELDPRTMSTNYDPATRSLNTIVGVAAHALIRLALYSNKKVQQISGEDSERFFTPIVRNTLERLFNNTLEVNLVIQAVLGWYFPQLVHLDSNWAKENRNNVFPKQPNKSHFWQAAWDAYIRFSDVYTNVFPLLYGEYERAIGNLPAASKEPPYDRPEQKLASHILKAFILELIPFESDDGLLKLYYQKANQEVRSHGNFWLSQLLSAQKFNKDSEEWKKIWILWNWRIDEAIASNKPNKFKDEIASFTRLLKHAPVNPRESEEVIRKMLDFDFQGFERHAIIEYLGKYAEEASDVCVPLLNKTIQGAENEYLIADTRNAIRSILIQVKQSDNAQSKRYANSIINLFGERGDYEWSEYLNDI